MKKVLVVGSGVGGSVIANELQGDYQVTILEEGNDFKPFKINLNLLETIKKTGLFYDENMIKLLFKAIKLNKINFQSGLEDLPLSNNELLLISGSGLGGSSTLSTGSGIRADSGLKKLGINLNDEFNEIMQSIDISIGHREIWNKRTKQLFQITKKLGLSPYVTPKMGRYDKCKACGHCILGCQHQVKWDIREVLNSALNKGAFLIKNAKVDKLVIKQNSVVGLYVKHKYRKRFMTADIIVLSAGGIGTPLILNKSNIEYNGNLFVDPVLCVAGVMEKATQNKEIPMPFIIEKEGYIISPYFDYLSFFFNKKWKYKSSNILSLMIKLADQGTGSISNYKIYKTFNDKDREKIRESINLCYNIFAELGIKKKDTFFGNFNAGHPGGLVPLTKNSVVSFKPDNFPSNLYISDSSLLPEAAGKPLILTIMALEKKVSKKIKEAF